MDVARSHRAPALAAVALGFVCLLAGEARAQGTTNGIRVGDGRLHPAVDVEVRYDSAAGFFRTPSGALELSSEALTHIRPRVKFEMPSETLSVGLDAELDLVRYTGLVTPGSEGSSRAEGAAQLKIVLNPVGNLTGEISNQFRRSDRTEAASLGVGVLSLWNETKVVGLYRPGGGALEIEPVLAYALEGFQPIASTLDGCVDVACDAAEIDRLAYQNVFAGVTARWRFLPKTAFTVETLLDHRIYRDTEAPKASLLRATFGMAGMLTQRIAIVAKVGWAQNMTRARGEGVIAQLEGNYLIGEGAYFKLGYQRNLTPVPAYGTYHGDRGYLDTRWIFGPKLRLKAYLGYEALTFGSGAERRDHLLSLDLAPEYQLGTWLFAGVGFVHSRRTSDVDVASLNYARSELYVRLTAAY